MAEEWRDIHGFEGAYQVSSHGGIRSLDRYVKHKYGGQRLARGCVLALTKNRHGYAIIELYWKGEGFKYHVHIIVLEAFVGPRPGNLDSCHDDGNRMNPRLDNLRWDTRRGNFADKEQHDTKQDGARGTNARLTYEQVKAIREQVARGRRHKDIAAEFKVHKATVSKLHLRTRWKPGCATKPQTRN